MPKLTLVNAWSWRDRARDALIGDGTVRFVEEDFGAPDSDGKERSAAEKRADAKMRSWIHTRISDELLPSVSDCATAFSLWKRVEESYLEDVAARAATLQSHLHGIAPGNDEPILEYIVALAFAPSWHLRVSRSARARW